MMMREEHNDQSSGTSTDSNITLKINNLSFGSRLSADDNILDYWETKKYVEPDLYQLSQIVLATPPAQVTVERAFSSLSLVLTNRRTRLLQETLHNILIVKLNSDLFKKISLHFTHIDDILQDVM